MTSPWGTLCSPETSDCTVTRAPALSRSYSYFWIIWFPYSVIRYRLLGKIMWAGEPNSAEQTWSQTCICAMSINSAELAKSRICGVGWRCPHVVSAGGISKESNCRSWVVCHSKKHSQKCPSPKTYVRSRCNDIFGFPLSTDLILNLTLISSKMQDFEWLKLPIILTIAYLGCLGHLANNQFSSDERKDPTVYDPCPQISKFPPRTHLVRLLCHARFVRTSFEIKTQEKPVNMYFASVLLTISGFQW